MKEFTKNLIEIIKSALNLQAEIAEDVDWEKIALYGKKHKIIPLLYYGVTNAGLEMPKQISDTFFEKTVFNISVSNKQLYEVERIKQEFLTNKIDFIMLKGATLKQYYPKLEMRPMGDVDILIKKEQYDKIRPIMQKLGFTEKAESNYELKWNKGQILIELHKRLTAPTNRDFCRYYGDGWRLAVPIENSSEFKYSKEDYFVYLFMHFTRHYRDAGIGILHLIDIYFYLKNNQDMNEEYLIGELKELRLADFYINIKKTIDVCFNNGEPDEKTGIILERILQSGSYGSASAKTVSVAAKNTQKAKSKKQIRRTLFWSRVFMPYADMCVRHKSLKKLPFLLPFFWIYRIFWVMFKSENLKRELKNLKDSEPEEVICFQKEMDTVGLDYNFDE